MTTDSVERNKSIKTWQMLLVVVSIAAVVALAGDYEDDPDLVDLTGAEMLDIKVALVKAGKTCDRITLGYQRALSDGLVAICDDKVKYVFTYDAAGVLILDR